MVLTRQHNAVLRLLRAAFLLIILLILLMTGSVFAQEDPNRGFEIGTLRLMPHLDVVQRYESNFLYRARGEEVDDFITITTLELVVEQSIANRHAVRIFGDASYFTYLDNNQYNHLNRRFGGEVDLRFPKFDIELSDVYWISSQPIFPEELGLIQRTGHQTSVASAIRLNRLTLSPKYKHDIYTYDDPSDFLDRTEDTFELRGEYEISRKTSLLSLFEHRRVTFDDDFIYSTTLPGLKKDMNLNRLTFGISKLLTNRIAGQLQVGLTQIDLDESAFEDTVKPFASFSLGGDLPNIGQTDLLLEHRVEPSLSVNYTYFEWDRVTLGVSRPLSRKIKAHTHVSYQILNYPEMKFFPGKLTRNEISLLSKRRDEWRSPMPAGADLLGMKHPDYDVHRRVFDIGLTYQIQKWLATSVEYTFRDNRSKDTEDWVNHRLDFSVGAGF